MSIPLPPRARLRLGCTSVVGAVGFLFTWGVRRKDGTLQTGGQVVEFVGTFGIFESQDVSVSDGELVWADIRQTGDGRQHGEAWTQLSIVYEGAPFPLSTIPVCQGFAGFVDGPSYPMRPQASAADGASPITWIPMSAVAPGVPQTLTLVGIEIAELWAARWTHTCDATVINRRPRLQIEAAAGQFLDWLSGGDFSAGTIGRVTFGASLGAENGVANIRCGPGSLTSVPPERVISCTSISLQAGDTITLGTINARWRPSGF